MNDSLLESKNITVSRHGNNFVLTSTQLDNKVNAKSNVTEVPIRKISKECGNLYFFFFKFSTKLYFFFFFSQGLFAKKSNSAKPLVKRTQMIEALSIKKLNDRNASSSPKTTEHTIISSAKAKLLAKGISIKPVPEIRRFTAISGIDSSTRWPVATSSPNVLHKTTKLTNDNSRSQDSKLDAKPTENIMQRVKQDEEKSETIEDIEQYMEYADVEDIDFIEDNKNETSNDDNEKFSIIETIPLTKVERINDNSNSSSLDHSQGEIFACRHCGKQYRWKSTLVRHETVECGGKAPSYGCPYCPYKAKQRGNLGVHVRKHHPQKPQLASRRKSRRGEGVEARDTD